MISGKMGDENLKAASGIPVEVGQIRRWETLPPQDWRPHTANGLEFRIERVDANDNCQGEYLTGGKTFAHAQWIALHSVLVSGPGLSAPAETMDERVQQVFLEDTEPFAVVDPFKSAPAATKEPERRAGQRYRASGTVLSYTLNKPTETAGAYPGGWHVTWQDGDPGIVTAEEIAAATLISEPESPAIEIRGNEWSFKTSAHHDCGTTEPKATQESEALTSEASYQHTVKLLGRLAEPKATPNPSRPIIDPKWWIEATDRLLAKLAPPVAPKAPQRLCGMVCTNPVSHPDSPLCEKHIYQAMVARDEARRAQVPSSTETGLETHGIANQSHLLGAGCLGVWALRSSK